MAHNRENMRLAGDAITSGEIKLNPAYKDKQRIACEFVHSEASVRLMCC